jgi:hypothetical protein
MQRILLKITQARATEKFKQQREAPSAGGYRELPETSVGHWDPDGTHQSRKY